MNKKWFIRGFGAGVLFTAVILGISFLIRTSDSFVTSRAKELGMVYAADEETKGTLARRETEAPVPSASALPTADSKTTGETPSVNSTAAPLTTPAATPAATAAATRQPKATKAPSNKKSSDKEIDMKKEKKRLEKEIREEEKKLTIRAGDWSSDVSRKLEDLGIIKSASDFDRYLERNGYSTSINAGTYDVSVDDTYNELARKITGR